MASLTLKSVVKKYGDVLAVDDFSMDIKDKEFIVFVGPSGCGKSTTLRMIAGLEEITEGEVLIGDKLVNAVAPKDRDIAMVFQNYALYPHMNVYENMALALKNKKFKKDEIDRRIREAGKILDLEDLYKRKPKELSGGQRQRVAIGRAIVRKPKVFLMDEPLSNLDAKLRVKMRAEIGSLHKRLETTFIYVTHDQLEAMTLGERIVVMNKGLIQQIGSPDDIYGQPDNVFVAGFIGSPAMNLIPGTIEEQGDDLIFNNGIIQLKLRPQRAQRMRELGYTGRKVICGIRPENLNVTPDTGHEQSCRELDFCVQLVENMGRESYIYFKIGDQEAVALASENVKFSIGQDVRFFVNMEKVHFFDEETQRVIR